MDFELPVKVSVEVPSVNVPAAAHAPLYVPAVSLLVIVLGSDAVMAVPVPSLNVKLAIQSVALVVGVELNISALIWASVLVVPHIRTFSTCVLFNQLLEALYEPIYKSSSSAEGKAVSYTHLTLPTIYSV